MNDAIEVTQPGSRSELLQLFDHRISEYQRIAPHLIELNSSALGEDSADGFSYIFFLREQGNLTASVRYTSLKHEWCPQLLKESRKVIQSYLADGFLEISRLIVGRHFRGANRLDLLLRGSTKWLIDNTGCKYYFAICNRQLVQLYTRYGSTEVKDFDLCRRDGTPHRYSLVTGTIHEVFEKANDRLCRYDPLILEKRIWKRSSQS